MKAAILTLVLAFSALTVQAADIAAGIVEPYLRIQTALSDDSVKGVAGNAAAIAAAAATLGGPARALHDAAQQLEAAKDVAAARLAFGKLSDALIAYANATNMGLGADVKLAYCPMASQSWAQKGDTISNPYYGKQMPGCGEFKKTK